MEPTTLVDWKKAQQKAALTAQWAVTNLDSVFR
jgi:hypothetical protein